MLSFFLRRLKLALITIFGVTLLVFGAARLSGDVVYQIVGDAANQEEIENMRRELGLDRPVWMQYFVYVAEVAQGDFGRSIRYQRPVIEVIAERIPKTVQLGLVAFVAAIVAGLSLGILAARTRGSVIDRAARTLAVLAQSMPHFWIGIMAILIFSVILRWLPTSGSGTWQHLVMPALTLATFPMAAIMRITRSSMLETLDAEYIKFLRVKGLAERLIVWKHALRNALIPVVALSGIQLGNLLGGAVIVETVFSWPGLGNLMVESIVSRDYPVIQSGVLLIAVFLISLNFLVDLVFGVIDPRIRYT
ncbi:MAG: Peptide transporter, permease protein [Rhodospirillales bacterium]|jgi:ABC-type dipeptide/oligopeptide/nickel transport system permease component|nr:Peptide transporter, permease protein [Rhodospirillales bacterium]